VNGYTINFNGTHLDKKGWVVVDTLKAGEYVLGVHDITTGTALARPEIAKLGVAPNPAAGHCAISFSVPAYKNSVITIADITGKIVFTTPVFSHQEKIEWDTYNIQNGTYLVSLKTDGKIAASQKIVVRK
jgi:hypothetical protein